jgi:hypothetical protein
MNANDTDTESTRLELQGSTVAGTEGPDLSNVSEIHDKGPPFTLSRPTWITRFAKQRSKPILFVSETNFKPVIRTSLVLHLVGTSAASQGYQPNRIHPRKAFLVEPRMIICAQILQQQAVHHCSMIANAGVFSGRSALKR